MVMIELYGCRKTTPNAVGVAREPSRGRLVRTGRRTVRVQGRRPARGYMPSACFRLLPARRQAFPGVNIQVDSIKREASGPGVQDEAEGSPLGSRSNDEDG